jgi:hypothetical protein
MLCFFQLDGPVKKEEKPYEIPEDLKKYTKMRKMGLHDNQIIGKMKMDGVDPKRIKEVN